MKFVKLPIVAILILGILCHGLILFNDGIYFDGWLLDSWVRESRSLAFFNEYFLAVGKPIFGFVFWILTRPESWLVLTKWLAFFSITGIAILQFHILVKTKLLNSECALWISLLSLGYPGFSMLVEPVTYQYVFCYLLYFLGLFLFMKSKRILANICLFFSFFMGSLLFVHYFFVILLIGNARQIKKIFLNAFDLLTVPLVFLVCRNFFFPPQGVYVEHYKVKFDSNTLNSVYESFFKEILFGEIFRFAKTYSSLLGILILISAIIISAKFKKNASDRYPQNNAMSFVLWSMIVLFAAALPYALVNQHFQSTGWGTKNNILFGLPLAVLIFSLANLIAKTAIRNFVLLTVLGHFVVVNSTNYIALQAAAIKDHWFVEKLQSNSTARESPLFQVYDNCQIFGFENQYDSYFITFVLSKGFKPRSKAGKLLTDPKFKMFTENEVSIVIEGYVPYLATPEVDIHGKQSRLVLERSKSFVSNLSLVTEYYEKKLGFNHSVIEPCEVTISSLTN